MAKEKTTKAEVEEKVEPKKKATKKAKPEVDRKAFIARKMKVINLMDNAFIAERQAERIMSRR